MQKPFFCAQPARIQIRQIPARSSTKIGFGSLVANQDMLHVEPHAACEQQSQRQTEFGVPVQQLGRNIIAPCYNL